MHAHGSLWPVLPPPHLASLLLSRCRRRQEECGALLRRHAGTAGAHGSSRRGSPLAASLFPGPPGPFPRVSETGPSPAIFSQDQHLRAHLRKVPAVATLFVRSTGPMLVRRAHPRSPAPRPSPLSPSSLWGSSGPGPSERRKKSIGRHSLASIQPCCTGPSDRPPAADGSRRGGGRHAAPRARIRGDGPGGESLPAPLSLSSLTLASRAFSAAPPPGVVGKSCVLMCDGFLSSYFSRAPR